MSQKKILLKKVSKDVMILGRFTIFSQTYICNNVEREFFPLLHTKFARKAK